MRFISGTTDVDTVGDAERIRNTEERVLWAKFTALPTNRGISYIGLVDVDATHATAQKGYPLFGTASGPFSRGSSENETNTLELDFRPGSVVCNVFYVDATVAGDDVGWAMMLA